MHPLDVIDQSDRGPLISALIVIVVFVAAVMAVVGRDTGRMGTGIVALQFAEDREETESIFREWGPDGLRSARASLVVDYVWLVAYSILLSLVCLYMADLAHDRDWWRGISLLGVTLSWLAFVAGTLDAVENSVLLVEIASGANDMKALIASTCAKANFGLIAACISYSSVIRVSAWIVP